MRAVVQRVTSARVDVDGDAIGAIDRGLLVYLGVADVDDTTDVAWMADKVSGARIFGGDRPETAEKMSRDVREVEGSALVVSQFTLLGDLRKGRRPSFDRAMRPAGAEQLYEAFVAELRARGVPTQTGRFGADMKVSSLNDGPVTLVIVSPREGDARNLGATSPLSPASSGAAG